MGNNFAILFTWPLNGRSLNTFYISIFINKYKLLPWELFRILNKGTNNGQLNKKLNFLSFLAPVFLV